MSSICTIIDFENKENLSLKTVSEMGETMKRRGPDQSGVCSCGFSVCHSNRLAVQDREQGTQPMSAEWQGKKYTIIYNGEIYNGDELRQTLSKHGITFKTGCDTETVLYTYIIFGEKCPEMLVGFFSFCVIDEGEQRVFVARDRLGVKPLFYTKLGSSYIIASEIKAILAHPKMKARLSYEGLWQLLFMSPVTVSGSGVFDDVFELKPAHCGFISKNGFEVRRYWGLKAERWSGSAEEAAKETERLFTEIVKSQLKSDVPLAVLLSGGLDSSVVTAVAAAEFKKRGEPLSTYSFEYEGNKESFKSSVFQPQGDDEYALYLADYLGTNHSVLTADNITVADKLFAAVDARDIPGQADIDSSLLHFCGEIKNNHTVVLSGECSDEIFGGYPWFYRPEMLYRDFFPWVHDPFVRANLFSDEFTKRDEGFAFVSSIYKNALAECPLFEDESEDMKTARRATWLSVNYFGAGLLERKDRMSMYSAVEARVPFADHRLLGFVYNVPWSIKFKNRREKALLRAAMSDWLPEKILYRKKSPYPKTHSPLYEKAVRERLEQRISRGGILSEYINPEKLKAVTEGTGGTWFGQLMSTPQLMAWLVQFDYWFEHYNVDLNV